MTYPAGTNAASSAPFGYWVPSGTAPLADSPEDFLEALSAIHSPVVIVRTNHGFAVARGGQISFDLPEGTRPTNALPVAANLSPLDPANLGDPEFLQDH